MTVTRTALANFRFRGQSQRSRGRRPGPGAGLAVTPARRPRRVLTAAGQGGQSVTVAVTATHGATVKLET